MDIKSKVNKILKYLKSICFILLLGMLGGSIAIFIKNIFNMETGSVADWIGSLGTILSLVFIYVQIREARDEYSRQYNFNFYS